MGAGIKEMRLARAGDPTVSAQVREAEEEGRRLVEGRNDGAADGRVRTVGATIARTWRARQSEIHKTAGSNQACSEGRPPPPPRETKGEHL